MIFIILKTTQESCSAASCAPFQGFNYFFVEVVAPHKLANTISTAALYCQYRQSEEKLFANNLTILSDCGGPEMWQGVKWKALLSAQTYHAISYVRHLLGKCKLLCWLPTLQQELRVQYALFSKAITYEVLAIKRRTAYSWVLYRSFTLCRLPKLAITAILSDRLYPWLKVWQDMCTTCAQKLTANCYTDLFKNDSVCTKDIATVII